MPANLTSRYQQLLTQDNFVPDPAQLGAVSLLADVADRLTLQPQTPIKGVYLWGDVGRGKTFLMDLFYDSITEQPKLRLHFHHFMARMHRELNLESGHSEPLTRIAKRLAKQCRVLCFDEFFVSDIGDAMILGRLFEALFDCGVTLVATSNIAIADLYQGGLQRQRFEPTIALLLQHTTSYHLDGDDDHRLRHLDYHQTYFELLPDAMAPRFSKLFNQLNGDGTSEQSPLNILGRDIEVVRQGINVVWLSFDAICNGPRCALDYIELAAQFDTVLISDVPVLGGECRTWIRARGTEDGAEATLTGERQLSYAGQDDPARRFISLVDELYDQNIKLYLGAQVAPAQLYSGGALSFEFRRTLSRLTEMQSLQYLERAAG